MLSTTKRSRKEVKSQRHNIWYMMLGAVIVLVAVESSYIFPIYSMEMFGSCSGIGKFYSNTTFAYDYNNLLGNYTENYEADANIFLVVPHPPDHIDNGTGVDCEDFAQAVSCLADLYGKECRLLYEIRAYGGDNNITQERHIGITCLIGSDWRILG
jgi:hypothetical protein